MRFPGTKLYRKLRYRKGFGIHSPFVYNLITKVIEEKSQYYAFREIENFHSELLKKKDFIAEITAKETQSSNYGAFLFRMINFFKCDTVIQVGCSTGVMSLYLVMASPVKSKYFLLEERTNLLNSVRNFLSARSLKGISFLEGDYPENIKSFQVSEKKADLIFINSIPEGIETDKFYSLIKPLISKTTILIIDNITKDKQKRNLWLKVQETDEVRITINLYSAGILFFNDKYPKKNYKAYLNNGKKQSIYKNRRYRTYISRWRKKSIKNKHAH